MVSLDGIPGAIIFRLKTAFTNDFIALFSGGQKSECVKFWDIRGKKMVYELATGNNIVNSMIWDAKRSTLYAATECDNIDRLGRTYNYRPFHRPTYPEEGKICGTPASRPQRARRRNKTIYYDEDADPDRDEDDYDASWYWPERAWHEEDYFGIALDAGSHAICKLII